MKKEGGTSSEGDGYLFQILADRRGTYANGRLFKGANLFKRGAYLRGMLIQEGYLNEGSQVAKGKYVT